MGLRCGEYGVELDFGVRGLGVIEITDLRKVYSGGVEALRGVNLSVKEGSSVGLVGPNGAGKTTTIRIVGGLLEPTSGSVKVFGKDIVESLEEITPSIGYAPDEYQMPDNLRVWEYLDYFGALYGMSRKQRVERVDHLLALVRLSAKRELFIGQLSRGMKQRLMLARTLIHNPDLLLLDEPTSGLDPRSRAEIVDVLRYLASAGKTMLVASNILYDLSGFCNSLAIMDHGRIVDSGTFEELSNKYCKERLLRIVVVSGMERVEQILSSERGVRSFTIEGNVVELRFDGGLEKMAELNEKLVRSGVKVCGVCEQARTLEEIFLRATD